MVASGSLLYLIISVFIPAAKAGRVDSCISLIICSWLGPAMQLLVMLLTPKSLYQQHRTLITLGFRVFYLIATSKNGFGVCGVGPITPPPPPATAAAAPTATAAAPAAAAAASASAAAAVGDPLESPFSAFTWRSGVIGLVWYSGAFPLPFRHHVWVQTLFVIVYCKTLSPLICSALDRVQHGPQTIAVIRSLADLIWSQILAAMGAPAAAAQRFEAAAAAAGQAGDVVGFLGLDQTLDSGMHSSSNSSSSTRGAAYRQCMHGLCFLQLLMGHALPTVALYCFEYHDRVHWWLAQQNQQQPSSSSSSSSNALSSIDHGLRPSVGNIAGSSSNSSGSSASLPAGEAVSAATAADTTGGGGGGGGGAAAAAAPASLRKRSASTAAAVAGTIHVLRTTTTSSSSSSAAAGSSSRGGTRLSAFDKESIQDSLPLTFREVYFLFIGLGITWISLGYLL